MARKYFAMAFQDEACKLVTEQHYAIATAGKQLGVGEQTLRYWLVKRGWKGPQQHGLPEFNLADITSEMDLLLQAKQDALALIAEDAHLQKPPHDKLRAAVETQFGQSLGLSRVG